MDSFFLDLLSDVQPSPLDTLSLLDNLDTSVNSDDNSSNTSLNSSDESSIISDFAFFPTRGICPQELQTEKLLPISKPITKKKRKTSATATIKEERKTSVTLDRELLINMSLDEFERKIEALTKGRSLTKEETNDIKRQRRLIKNRHSAMASRERKREEFTILKQENDALKKEVGYLKSVIEFLTVGKAIPSTDTVPFLLIFGILFSVIFWSQSPIPMANHVNVTHSSSIPLKVPPKLLNLNVQQEVRQTPVKDSSPFGRELMSYKSDIQLNDTLENQMKENHLDDLRNNYDTDHTNYVFAKSSLSQIKLFLPEVGPSVQSISDESISAISQSSSHLPSSIKVM